MKTPRPVPRPAVTVPTDHELMLAYRGGDRAAFDQLFERYREPVWRFFRRRFVDPTIAEELTQETFVALVAGARKYEPRAEFRSYLFGIAFNQLLAARRRVRREQARSAEPRDVAADSSDPAAVIWVKQALAALDETEREILMLREYDALSYDEIAGLLGVPIGTVRSRLFRAREALRASLAGREMHEVVR